MTPSVSIIMPVRDAGAYLAAAVDSILAQSLSDFELLLIDDHSRDDAIAALPKADPRLQVLANPGHGLVEALNFGFAQARGDWLARMDGDDLAAPTRLAAQLDLLQRQPQIAIVATQVQIFGAIAAAGSARYQRWLNALCRPEDIARELFIESPLPHPSVMLRRAAWEALGGYRDDAGPEDYDLWLRAAELGLAMAKPDGILLHWRDHHDRLTRRDARYSAAKFWATKARHLLRWRAADRALLIWGSGPSGVALHDALVAQGCAPERLLGFVDLHPRRIGGHKRGLPVMPLDATLQVPPTTLILVAVGSPGAREEIRQWFAERGRVEGVEFLFCA